MAPPGATRSGCRGEAPCPPEATGAKRNSYIAKLKILPRGAEAELTEEVNSPARPEGRALALSNSRGAFLNIVFRRRRRRSSAFGAGG